MHELPELWQAFNIRRNNCYSPVVLAWHDKNHMNMCFKSKLKILWISVFIQK